MSGIEPPPHPVRSEAFSPLAHLLKHLQDSPPTSPQVFTPVVASHSLSTASLTGISTAATHDPEDILREIRADGDNPFPIDRATLMSVVKKKMHSPVEDITFLSSGTFHKAFLVTLEDGREIVARIARRFMPRLKTESEVATINYIRQQTNVPVPIIYYYDSNPYNRLGGEYILMSKAPGVPLSRRYHELSDDTLRRLFTNLATHLLTLFSHRFPRVGSLYQTPTHPNPISAVSAAMHPKPSLSEATVYQFHVGPMVSWPFFGGGRGEMQDIPRGPWKTELDYLYACAQRELQTVQREGEGRLNAHRPHMPPEDENSSSDSDHPQGLTILGRHVKIDKSHHHHHHHHKDHGPAPLRRPAYRRHHSHLGSGLTNMASASVSALNSTNASAYNSESDADSSEEEFYRDYRSNLRSSLLVAHQAARLDSVREDMMLFVEHMKALGIDDQDPEFKEFSMDLHDISLNNVFVDPDDPGKITCIIDWESTAIRPLWHCAHLPSFLASDPTSSHAQLFREIVAQLGEEDARASTSNPPPDVDGTPETGGAGKGQQPPLTNGHIVSPPAHAGDWRRSEDLTPTQVDRFMLRREAKRWLKGERERAPWRNAHRVVEWDGWEEGLVRAILLEIPLSQAMPSLPLLVPQL